MDFRKFGLGVICSRDSWNFRHKASVLMGHGIGKRQNNAGLGGLIAESGGTMESGSNFNSICDVIERKICGEFQPAYGISGNPFPCRTNDRESLFRKRRVSIRVKKRNAYLTREAK